jgi:hypothetical protein
VRVAGIAVVLASSGCSDGPTAPDVRFSVERPDVVRGVYVSAFAAGDPERLQALLDLAAESRINTFVVDVKEFGEVSYASAVPLAGAVGATRRYIPDLADFMRTLREAGIYPIARIVCFRDPVLAEGRPDFAIRNSEGGVWIDQETQHPWVDPYNEEVWAYNIDLAREALEAGFAEIQWDYVRFPDLRTDNEGRALVFPSAAGRTPLEAVAEFVERSRAELASFGAPVTADVFGRVVSTPPDDVIGQGFEALVRRTDILLPMVYPSLYWAGSFGVADPAREPYAIVRAALDSAVARLRATPGAIATLRPWLQAFSQDGVVYGPNEILEQIRAAEDAGLEEWLFWNPISAYPRGVF